MTPTENCSEQGEDGKAMSLGRATALAKLPSALEWLRCWRHVAGPCAIFAHALHAT